MTLTYYRYLFCAFIIFSIAPLGYYLYNKQLAENTDTQSSILTEYNFVDVDHPIQPLPQQITIDKNWLALGKALFNSPLLSKDNSISCSSCHLVDFGGDDGFAVSTGVGGAQGSRNSPTVLNAVFNIRQFWDGRSSSLADQVSGPIHNPVEMASTWPEITNKLQNDSYFTTSFEQLSASGITQDNIIKAITIYEQSLITPNAPIDKFLLGDENALTAQQKRGYKKFVSYGCITCHQGRNIGGNILQKLGRINAIPETLKHDRGKFELTKKDIDLYVFKVPSLRNIALTAPYFHNGSVNNLEQAVQIMAKVQLGIELSTQDTNDIVALLESFSAPALELTP